MRVDPSYLNLVTHLKDWFAKFLVHSTRSRALSPVDADFPNASFTNNSYISVTPWR
jgi:hypothetical protein